MTIKYANEMVILRGIPGSGKSTIAMRWLEEGPNRARINRDEIRQSVFGKDFNVDETMVSIIEQLTLANLLERRYDVIIDNMNVRWSYVKAYAETAKFYNYGVTIQVVDVPLDVAIQRNYQRFGAGGRFVPVDVIERNHKTLESNKHMEL